MAMCSNEQVSSLENEYRRFRSEKQGADAACVIIRPSDDGPVTVAPLSEFGTLLEKHVRGTILFYCFIKQQQHHHGSLYAHERWGV